MVSNIMRFALHDGPGIRTTVFLKGCPLACWWCHNPENQDFRPSLMYFEDRCLRCGACASVCPQQAVAIENGAVNTGAACRRCGACIEACLAGARQLAGRKMTVSEALREVERDIAFFDESGGGVTLSGGEPLSQPAFTEALLSACRERRIHTALDTSGFAPRDVLLEISARADLVLFDWKLFDPARHRMYTGVDNAAILSNLEALVAAGRRIVVRFPVIPGINDSDEEVRALAGFVSRLGLRRIDLLPYHRIGKDKFRRLGRACPLDGLEPPPPGQVNRIAEELQALGFTIRIGG